MSECPGQTEFIKTHGDYDVLMIDPPWTHASPGAVRPSDRIDAHYDTMSLDEIKALPIDDWAARNCVLYLWATPPLMPEAFEVMKAWRFTFKTSAVWDKEWIAMGFWFRAQHELLLVGTRGDASPPEQSLRKSSVFSEKRREHSRKPDCVRAYIESCFPDASRVEVFARKRFPGWDAIGFEIDGKIIGEKPRGNVVQKELKMFLEEKASG